MIVWKGDVPWNGDATARLRLYKDGKVEYWCPWTERWVLGGASHTQAAQKGYEKALAKRGSGTRLAVTPDDDCSCDDACCG